MAAVTNYHKCNTETPVAKTTQVYYLMVLEVGNLNVSHWAKVEVLARLCCLAQALGEHAFPCLFLLLGAHILLCSLLPSVPGWRWRVESPHVTPTPCSLMHPLMRSPVADLDNPELSLWFSVLTLIPSAEALFAKEGKICTNSSDEDMHSFGNCDSAYTVTFLRGCVLLPTAECLLVPELRGTGKSP